MRHGQGNWRKGRTPTYLSWSCMRQRCNNPAASDYARYGGRGIRVCERWSEFANFLADMGPRPEGTTLDRKENDGNYEPGNCRWVDRKTQNNNTRANRLLTIGGTTLNVQQWAEISGTKYQTIYARLNKHGWPPKAAVFGRAA